MANKLYQMTPKEIVQELDKYIIGQDEAKKSVAIALRNRYLSLIHILSDTAFFGELSLDGRLNRIKGALPLVMCMRKAGIRNIVLPEGNAEEAAILEDVNIFPAACLSDVASFLSGKCSPEVYIRKEKNSRQDYSSDFSQVIGQESAKRAIVIGCLLYTSYQCIIEIHAAQHEQYGLNHCKFQIYYIQRFCCI